MKSESLLDINMRMGQVGRKAYSRAKYFENAGGLWKTPLDPYDDVSVAPVMVIVRWDGSYQRAPFM